MSSPDDHVNLHVHIPRWVKDMLFECAEREGVTVGVFASSVLLEAARDTMGLPAPPPAVARVPTVQEVLRAYVEGSADRLIGPCGELWPCGYEPADSAWISDCLEFCGKCNIRVN